MNLLFSMSLAGSLVFLVYLVLRPVAVRYFSSVWRYRMLKLVLVFYLLPYQYLKNIYYDIFCIIFFNRQYINPECNKGYYLYDMNRLAIIDSEGNWSVKNEKILFTVFAMWCIAVISFAIYQTVKYISCRGKLRQISTALDVRLCRILEQCRRHACMKRKVGLSCCSHIRIPFTIGVFSPRIVIPETMKEEEARQMAVSHELTHVKNHDIFIKFVSLLVLVLHWFNPLVYLLYWEICRVSEYVCDEAVTRGMTEEEKERYQLLILELSQKPVQTNTIFVSALSSNYKMIKERITLMNRSIISKKYMRVVSCALAVLLFMLSSLSVLAYSPIIECSDSSDNCSFKGEMYYSTQIQNLYCLFGVYDPFLEVGTEYDIFINDSGELEIVYEIINQTERSICFHVWENGLISRHIKNDDGSCILYFYEGQRCTKCSACKLGNLYNSMQFPKCPH